MSFLVNYSLRVGQRDPPILIFRFPIEMIYIPINPIFRFWRGPSNHKPPISSGEITRPRRETSEEESSLSMSGDDWNESLLVWSKVRSYWGTYGLSVLMMVIIIQMKMSDGLVLVLDSSWIKFIHLTHDVHLGLNLSQSSLNDLCLFLNHNWYIPASIWNSSSCG